MARADGIVLKGPIEGRFAEILTPTALAFVTDLQRELGTTRDALLRRRSERQAALDAGGRLDFLPETRGIRDGAWTVAPAPKDLQRRWVELTGPDGHELWAQVTRAEAEERELAPGDVVGVRAARERVFEPASA